MKKRDAEMVKDVGWDGMGWMDAVKSCQVELAWLEYLVQPVGSVLRSVALNRGSWSQRATTLAHTAGAGGTGSGIVAALVPNYGATGSRPGRVFRHMSWAGSAPKTRCREPCVEHRLAPQRRWEVLCLGAKFGAM